MIKLVNDINEANCITHAGNMHADDVFSTAFLELYQKNIYVFRTPNIPSTYEEKENVFIYDIGLGKYDHHQTNARIRDDGIIYCSFGLLWESYGKDFLEKENYSNVEDLYQAFIKDLVEAIDADDNGQFPKIDAPYKVKTLSDIIKLYNPKYGCTEDINDQFLKAVEFAKTIIIEELYSLSGRIIAKKHVLELLPQVKDHVLVLEEHMPYLEAVLEYDLKNKIYYAIFPSNRGGYMVKALQKTLTDHTLRKPFPKEWCGLDEKDLERMTGIKDITFCHNGQFLCATRTKEAAYLLATLASSYCQE